MEPDPVRLLEAIAVEVDSSEETPRSSVTLADEISGHSNVDRPLEREETIEELLNGKDSVTMFGHRSSKAFHIDMSSGGDPLDCLMANVRANSVAARPLHGATSSQQSASSMRNDQLVLVDLESEEELQAASNWGAVQQTRSELKHRQELAYRCRHALHTQFDQFLNGAARRERESAAAAASTVLEERLDECAWFLTSTLAEANCSGPDKEIREKVKLKQRVLSLSAQNEATTKKLQDQIQSLEMLNCEVNDSLVKAQAQNAQYKQRLEAANKEIRSSAQEKREALEAQATSYGAGLDEARRELKRLREELEISREDAMMLRGERQVLRGLDAQQLTELAETLTESLLRVQREHQRRFDQHHDEQLCVVCLTDRKNVVLRPCNHLTMCVACFSKCKNACPQCRAPVEDHLVIYM